MPWAKPRGYTLRPCESVTTWRAGSRPERPHHVVEGLLVGAGADESTRIRLNALVHDVNQATSAAENDQKLLAKLDDIRTSRHEDSDGSGADSSYADAFRDAGLDMAVLTSGDAGTAQIRDRPVAVRIGLATALDEWADVRSRRNDKAGARWLAEIARRADSDFWRNRFREVYMSPLADAVAIAMLKGLAESPQAGELPPVSLHLLGSKLLEFGDRTAAENLLRKAQRRYPGDYWLNQSLARCLAEDGRNNEAIWYFIAAQAIRPGLTHEIAHTLWALGPREPCNLGTPGHHCAGGPPKTQRSLWLPC